MDSFTMLFAARLSPPQISRALEDAGFDAQTQSTGSIGVSTGNAHVWLHITRGENLSPSDCEDEAQWPVPRDRVGMLVTIEVRRNLESDDLAVKVADQLVRNFGATLLWDGMDRWEKLYHALVERT
jgi:hypothetical protein